MKLRRLMAAGLASLLVTALAACGGGAGSSNSDEPVTIKFQSLAFLPESQKAVKKIVDDFNADHPEIKVELVQGSWDNVHDQLVTQLAGGTAPDVIHDESADITAFAQDGYLADLSGLDKDLKSGINQGIWDAVTVDGKVVAAPTLLQSYLVFANKKMLDEAGVTIPTGETMTWDEFAKISKQVKDKTGKPGVGWGLKSPTATIMNLSFGFGGTFFEGSGKDAKIKAGASEMEIPKRIAAMTANGGLDKSTLSQSGSDVLPGFYKGNYAMTVQGSYQASAFASDAPKGFDWVALPALAGTQDASQAANPQTLSVAADSKYIDQATTFVNYFMQADQLASVAEGETLFPSSAGAQQKVLADTGGKDGWNEIIASGKTLKKAPFQSVDNYPQWKDQIATPAFQQYLAGKIDDATLQKKLVDGWAAVDR